MAENDWDDLEDEGEPPPRGVLPGPVEPIHPALMSQLRQQREWLSHRENREKYAGEIVIIYGSEVLGHGTDHFTAVRMAEAAVAAKPEADRPPEGEVTSVFVPHRYVPESPLS
jgi:hypothetical protein